MSDNERQRNNGIAERDTLYVALDPANESGRKLHADEDCHHIADREHREATARERRQKSRCANCALPGGHQGLAAAIRERGRDA